MSKLPTGHTAPDLSLQTVEGNTTHLSEIWPNASNTLLIFLRHLAWLPCREHVVQVVSHYSEIQALGAQVVAISFGTPYWAQIWLKEIEPPFPLLLDPTHEGYRAYGLMRSHWRAFSLKTLLYYFRASRNGEEILSSRGDTAQLGGNFIIDRNGIVRFAYASQEPIDRPPIETLLDALHQVA